ncbi:hypothetical protein CGCF415_v001812 [Colletotrichum fructicola]|uniref:Uncharacterized protein n=1 Tax=Colletotrichum fructicola (strain Nara gc5) TaxID=1213859 RepID=A0A7J6IUM6_COLFN|nr:hypothetical protein CGGC5_v012485 [Colletotrichum fructicola Nara gc5]KAF4884223.1 hypothetical protein CGCFRS4_v012882 [Colletotrichum fructicola]KAF4915146.1 hypothetical protein CGCF415_v001812 [Colletotrichum fructicola]KAF4935717.1 hypothetical protein CGCF245_v007370 [Colletotrichum fructicola]KAF5491166.1 hypothetical protein CGCF413_v011426 [Colletotrichum fructicola]
MNTVRYHCLERDVSTDAERPTILSNPKRPDMGSTPESPGASQASQALGPKPPSITSFPVHGIAELVLFGKDNGTLGTL